MVDFDNENSDYLSGMKLAQASNWEQAIKAFSNAIDHEPENKAALFARGFCYSKTHDLQRSVDDYTKLVELSPSGQPGGFSEVIAQYGRDATKNPQDDCAFLGRGLLHEAISDYEAATIDYSAAALIRAKAFTDEGMDEIFYRQALCLQLLYPDIPAENIAIMLKDERIALEQQAAIGLQEETRVAEAAFEQRGKEGDRAREKQNERIAKKAAKEAEVAKKAEAAKEAAAKAREEQQRLTEHEEFEKKAWRYTSPPWKEDMRLRDSGISERPNRTSKNSDGATNFLPAARRTTEDAIRNPKQLLHKAYLRLERSSNKVLVLRKFDLTVDDLATSIRSPDSQAERYEAIAITIASRSHTEVINDVTRMYWHRLINAKLRNLDDDVMSALDQIAEEDSDAATILVEYRARTDRSQRETQPQGDWSLLDWEILPQDVSGSLVGSGNGYEHGVGLFDRVPGLSKERTERLNFILGLGPREVLKGKEGFLSQYVAFTFESHVVCEHGDYGNAIYLLTGTEDWGFIFKNPKKDARRMAGGRLKRIIHKGDWKIRLELALQSADY
jgi:tetratricopeptide (TPR) repeat protein